jgi:hypothetical protein
MVGMRKIDSGVILLMTVLHLTIFSPILSPAPSAAMEELTDGELHRFTGQAGITMALSGFQLVRHQDSLRLSDVEGVGYLDLKDHTFDISISAGASNVDGDDEIGFLNIDLLTVDDSASPVYGKPLLQVECSDVDMRSNFSSQSLDWSGSDIGSTSFTGITQPRFEVFIGAHDGGGVDLEYSGTVDIEEYRYNYNATQALSFSGIHLSGTAQGDRHDPSTWSYEGSFSFGSVMEAKPVTMDVVADDNETWVVGGTEYPNPRYGAGYIALDVPMEGSFRMEAINFGGNEMGPLVMDGVRIHKLYIEIPGRGLGK